MIEVRVEELEREVAAMKEKEKVFISQVRDLQEIINEIVESRAVSTEFGPQVEEGKIKYLTEVNEQMFQQNKRLRKLIEACIAANQVPTHHEYSKALQG